MSARTRTDWILWGCVGCALVGTAHSEWSLAVSVGAHPWIAAAVPGALDLYVLRALRVHRDVFLAVLAMVAANVSWYLVHSGDLPVDWPLRSAVGALAPLVLWRVHSLKYTRTRKELLWGAEAGAGSAPDERSAPECEYGPECDLEGCTSRHPLPKPVWHSAPGYVPAEWSAPAPHLKAVPDLAPAFDPVSAVHSFPDVVHLESSALHPGDEVHLAGAQEYLDHCALTDTEPSVRGLKNALKVGQDRAGRIMKHLQSQEES